ncbi:MAG: 23S rRNA (uracil(1939)-C(5))-methyltransferase RlmD [Saprospiraceae bacterium]
MAFKKYIENFDIVDIADRGKAVGKSKDGKVVFLTGVVPGDKAEVLIYKKRKGNLEGKVVRILEESPFRVKPVCSHFEYCGGCKWQNLNYEKQLEYKDNQVKASLQRIAKVETEKFLPILGSEEEYYYRNKLEFSFSNKRWLTDEEVKSEIDINQENVLGFHASGNFEKIIPIEHCYLQADPSNQIRNFIRDFTLDKNYSYWDAKNHLGLMRNIIVRTSSLGQVMVTISFSENENIFELLDALKNNFPNITSLNYVINSKFNDSIFDLDIINYHGEKYIKEKLGDTEFIISPKSFFQTNTHQSQRLYDIAIGFADFKGDETVLDLYTGIGSIALYMAGMVKKVIGVEVIPEAIDDAKINALQNNIQNAEFIVGDVKDILLNNIVKPDIIFVDPPRAGLDKKVVEEILKLNPQKIIYISCNPATQARDIFLMKDDYTVKNSQAVDMFPHTHHIENVVELVRKI